MKLISKQDAAKKLLISYSQIDKFRKTFPDFPKPMCFGKPTLGSKLFWDEDDLDMWLAKNKVQFTQNANL